MTDTDVTPPAYKDDDLVYVDPKLKIVVGRVEFLPNGKSKPLPIPAAEVPADDPVEGAKDEEKGKRRVQRQRFYPWGTYRSMKRIYKLEGKVPKEESNKTLDEVIEKAVKEPFWD